MIDRQGGQILIECDGCDEVLETGTSDFDAAIKHKHTEGWGSRKVGNDWLDLCPACRKTPR